MFAVVGADTLFSVAATVDSRFPDFRSPVTLKSLSRCGRNSGGRWFVFFKFGTVDLAVSKEATSHQALPPALYWELEDPSFCPDPQCHLTTLHPK